MERSISLLEFIFGYIRDNGYQPSAKEMREFLNVSGDITSSILKEMEEVGLVKLTGKDRAISFPTLTWEESREVEWKGPDKEMVILNFIRQHLSAHGYQPSVDEIGDAVGVSRITAMKRIENLHQMGVVFNTGNGRALRLIGSKWYPKEKPQVA